MWIPLVLLQADRVWSCLQWLTFVHPGREGRKDIFENLCLAFRQIVGGQGAFLASASSHLSSASSNFYAKRAYFGVPYIFCSSSQPVSSLVWWTDHSWIRVSVSNTQFPRSYISIKYHFSPCLPSTCEVRVLNSDIKNVVQLNFIVLDLASYSCLFEISLGFDLSLIIEIIIVPLPQLAKWYHL